MQESMSARLLKITVHTFLAREFCFRENSPRSLSLTDLRAGAGDSGTLELPRKKINPRIQSKLGAKFEHCIRCRQARSSTLIPTAEDWLLRGSK